MSEATVVGRQDQSNRRFLRSYSNWISPYKMDELEHGTPEQRADAVRHLKRRALLAFGAVVVVGLSLNFLPASTPPALPAPVVKDAGVVEKIVLHETSLSTTSSIHTPDTVYQVAGAVSGRVGENSLRKHALEAPLCA